MLKIPGVKISIAHDGVDVSIADDGYIGELKPGTATLFVSVEPGEDTIGFRVDRKKQIMPARNQVVEANCGAVYVTNVRVRESRAGVPVTDYPENHIRLLSFTDFCGGFTIWEIALISQGGSFFLTTQDQLWRAYRDGDNVVARSASSDKTWTSLNAWLTELFRDCADSLPPLSECPAYEEEITARDLPSNQGSVLFWSEAQGWGAVVTPQGVARLHWSHVQKSYQRRVCLARGERVVFESFNRTDPHSRHLTEFDAELRGVIA